MTVRILTNAKISIMNVDKKKCIIEQMPNLDSKTYQSFKEKTVQNELEGSLLLPTTLKLYTPTSLKRPQQNDCRIPS